jgi:hypothetical protein
MRVSAKEWVPYAEIIAAFGVVISLLFVGYELNSNNAIQQATNDNLLYEMQDSLFESLSTNSVLATSVHKLGSGEELTQTEAAQYAGYLWRYMNMWEMAYERYHEGLLAEVQWQSWNRAFEYDLVHLPTGMPRQQWESGRITYGKSFAAHVDELYRQIDLGS